MSYVDVLIGERATGKSTWAHRNGKKELQTPFDKHAAKILRGMVQNGVALDMIAFTSSDERLIKSGSSTAAAEVTDFISEALGPAVGRKVLVSVMYPEMYK